MMKTNRLALFVCAFLALPGLLPAQESKLTNCRSLEAAGNFIGPDEVLDGDRVCKRAKPGDVSTIKAEAAKPTARISNAEPMSVAEAARANATAKAEARKAAAESDMKATKPSPRQEAVVAEPVKPAATAATPAPISPTAPAVPASPPAAPARQAEPVAAAPAPAPAVAPAHVEPASSPAQPAAPAVQPPAVATPEFAKPSPEPAPATPANPVSVSAPAVSPAPAATADPPQPADEPGPAFTSQVAPVVNVQHTGNVASPSAPAPAARPAPAVRIHRDAPVAPGTPSEPPEIDHGFSDANAVEVPAIANNGMSAARSAAAQSSGHGVQLGGFEKTTDAAAQTPSTGSQPAPSAADCAKNITLGNLRDGKLSLGAPAWAEKWIAKNQKRLENVCFSAAPLKGARNYLIVFYTAPGNGPGGAIAALPLPDATSGAGAFTAKDGSAWHYAAERTDPTAASDGAVTQVWYATAYTEAGAPVAERWPDSSKLGEKERASEDLLNAVVEDLRKL